MFKTGLLPRYMAVFAPLRKRKTSQISFPQLCSGAKGGVFAPEWVLARYLGAKEGVSAPERVAERHLGAKGGVSAPEWVPEGQMGAKGGVSAPE